VQGQCTLQPNSSGFQFSNSILSHLFKTQPCSSSLLEMVVFVVGFGYFVVLLTFFCYCNFLPFIVSFRFISCIKIYQKATVMYFFQADINVRN